MRAVERDFFARLIRAVDGELQGSGRRGHAEHTAAVRRQFAVFALLGRAMKHLHGFGAVQLAVDVETFDRVAALHFSGIAFRRHDHADGGFGFEFQIGLIELALNHGFDQIDEVRADARQDALALRIAEAHVVLQHFRAALGDHDAGVQQPFIGALLAAQRVQRWDENFFYDAVFQLWRDQRRWGIRAHAAGVRTLVVVVHALVILRAGQHGQRRAVGQSEDRGFFAAQSFFD